MSNFWVEWEGGLNKFTTFTRGKGFKNERSARTFAEKLRKKGAKKVSMREV